MPRKKKKKRNKYQDDEFEEIYQESDLDDSNSEEKSVKSGGIYMVRIGFLLKNTTGSDYSFSNRDLRKAVNLFYETKNRYPLRTDIQALRNIMEGLYKQKGLPSQYNRNTVVPQNKDLDWQNVETLKYDGIQVDTKFQKPIIYGGAGPSKQRQAEKKFKERVDDNRVIYVELILQMRGGFGKSRLLLRWQNK